MKLFVVFAVVALSGVYVSGEEQQSEIASCLKKDSISCLQMIAFRKAREFFNQKSIPIFTGLSLDKKPVEGRDGRSSESILDEQKVETSEGVEARSNAIQSYVSDRLANFINQRALNLNLADMARSFMGLDNAEEEVEVEEVGEEGRADKKKKKIIKKAKKSLLPLLIAIKMKLALLAVITLFGIALIAKKAILASLISLAISGFIGIKKLLAKKSSHHYVAEEVSPYHGGGGGWASGGGWDYHGDSHGSYSSPVAQHLAYSGHKSSNR